MIAGKLKIVISFFSSTRIVQTTRTQLQQLNEANSGTLFPFNFLSLASSRFLNDFSQDFISRHNIAVYLSSMGGRYWLRLSAGIFSTREDVDKIREALVEFCKEEGGL